MRIYSLWAQNSCPMKLKNDALDRIHRCKAAILQPTSLSDQIPFQNIVFTQADMLNGAINKSKSNIKI